jgi:uncharacterized membrane protein
MLVDITSKWWEQVAGYNMYQLYRARVILHERKKYAKTQTPQLQKAELQTQIEQKKKRQPIT